MSLYWVGTIVGERFDLAASKPHLMVIIYNGLKDCGMREKLLKLIGEKENIPPLPDILLRLEAKIEDPKSNISDIAVLIETEPVLSGRLIKLSNSVFFGGGREKIENLSSAILRLGLKMVLDLAYTLEIPKMFMKGKGLNQKKFWEHSLAVAILARLLSRRCDNLVAQADLCYLSGLMHDIGIVIFNFFIPDEYNAFLKDIKGVAEPLEKLEMERFGMSHPELGSLFIKKWWPVPDEVVFAVGKHYLEVSDPSKDHPTLLMVIIANTLANNFELENGISSFSAPHNEPFLLELGLTPTAIQELLEEARESLYIAKEVLYN